MNKSRPRRKSHARYNGVAGGEMLALHKQSPRTPQGGGIPHNKERHE